VAPLAAGYGQRRKLEWPDQAGVKQPNSTTFRIVMRFRHSIPPVCITYPNFIDADQQYRSIQQIGQFSIRMIQAEVVRKTGSPETPPHISASQ
jgi:hypothetical protein